ncbi:Las1-like protein [Moelleriella libera RCEF 2490]|uniref:Las1-like protein n=1 Tax=Moelleriella libera RCEF 2490 TaxID=1081109 RepID=A0A162INI5_9HYPO|nr:Las1-like protein [Moelleriella libera RCEF 2490]
MVQYIPTPWRDHKELLLVRHQFYGTSANADDDDNDNAAPLQSRQSPPPPPPPSSRRQHLASPDDEADKQLREQRRQAVERVSMWMRRGHCPHMVESTALLVAAILSDAGEMGARYAVRAAYSAAFSRFVTGLADGHQEKQRKQSMYSVAKTIGLPATFVELRHQATHEQLPSLARLRPAAHKALDWIWNYYWKHLDVNEAARRLEPCKAVIMGHLRGGSDDDMRMMQTVSALDAFDVDLVLAAIGQVQESLPGNQAYLRCLRLSKEVIKRRQDRHARNQAAEVNEKQEVDDSHDDGSAESSKKDEMDTEEDNSQIDGDVS